MVRYELKKIFGSVGSKVALLLYAGVVVLSCWLAASGALNLEVNGSMNRGKVNTDIRQHESSGMPGRNGRAGWMKKS